MELTLLAWYATYKDLYARSLSPRTIASYDRIMSLISPIIGHNTLPSIKPDDIQRALIHVDTSAGSRQAQIAYALLHALLCRAARSRHITDNPIMAIDRPSHTPSPGRAISGDDWHLLQPIIDGNPAYAIMAYAGLRRGELLGLRRSDIDLSRDIISVSRQRIRTNGALQACAPKSASSVRIIPIIPRLRPIIANACRDLMPTAWIYTASPETLAARWRHDQITAGITYPYRLHDLRHTYASHMIAAGCNPRILQYMIGHADLAITMRTYTHIGPTEALAEVARLHI